MQQLKVTRKFDISGARVIGFGLPFRIGKIFYVNGSSGTDNNSGLDPDQPLLELSTAFDKCTANHDDYIIVLDHYQATTQPISADVAGVHIICVGSYNVGQPMVYFTPAADTAALSIAADYIEVAGVEFGAGATHAGIEGSGSYGYGYVHDCVFGRMQTGRDGYLVAATWDNVEQTIEDCIFSGSGLTRDGIRIEHNMTRGIIRRNLFLAVDGIGIDVTGQMAQGYIADNRFMLPSDTAGKAITLGASCAGIYVSNNFANFGDTDSMANIPWVDGGTADYNTWDNNLTAGVVDYPA